MVAKSYWAFALKMCEIICAWEDCRSLGFHLGGKNVIKIASKKSSI